MRVPEAGPCPGFEVKTTVENQTDIGSQCWAGTGVPMPGGSGEQKFVGQQRIVYLSDERLTELIRHAALNLNIPSTLGVKELFLLITEAKQQRDILGPLNRLRYDEGAAVTFHNDNPEGPPNCSIDVCDDWTDYKLKTFMGDSLSQCLAAAEAARKDGG